jgi:putative tricarboxylic transport membrane protein
MTKERGGSLIFLAAGIYGGVFSLGLPMGRWSEPGPGVFPLLISILLCVSGVVWFIRGKAKREEQQAATAVEGPSRKYATAARIVGVTAAFILFLEPLGFVVTSTAYLFVLFCWVSRYRLWSAALLAVVFGTGSWLFFEKLLNTPLPNGLFHFLP